MSKVETSSKAEPEDLYSKKCRENEAQTKPKAQQQAQVRVSLEVTLGDVHNDLCY